MGENQFKLTSKKCSVLTLKCSTNHEVQIEQLMLSLEDDVCSFIRFKIF